MFLLAYNKNLVHMIIEVPLFKSDVESQFRQHYNRFIFCIKKTCTKKMRAFWDTAPLILAMVMCAGDGDIKHLQNFSQPLVDEKARYPRLLSYRLLPAVRT
jgi:hypothetical protein